MKRAIYIFLLISNVLSLKAQESEIVIENNPENAKIPFYNGLIFATDLYGLGTWFFGSDMSNAEVSISANLKHKFFPIIELGLGRADALSEKDVVYKSTTPYARIGINYNTMAKKGSKSYLYAGVRYGFSSFKYDVSGPDIEDLVWGGTVPYNYKGESSTAQWLELLVGVKAEIIKNFALGWSLRYKAPLSVKDNIHSTPWYVPGMGKNKSGFGMSYDLIYVLPF
ncbi:MAG: DUF6048 family protein [Bacteroides sp.]|nr:DUF6048 family protein [Bacteroides sp.]